MRLLPDDPQTGWTRYLWLIYLIGFVAVPWMKHAGVLEWTLTLGGTLLFLALYFLGHWIKGPKVIGVMAAITALGAAFTPFNPGAPSLFIYAGGFAGNVGSTRLAMTVVAAIAAVCAFEGWVLHLPVYGWIWAVPFTILIGIVNLHYAEVGRGNARLRLAHDEIERLAQVAERERIARDLHDLLGHTLSLIVLKSELASKLADSDPARAREEIKDVERISRETLAEVRRAVRGYRSAGLAAEIEASARALESAGITVERAVEPVRVPATVETALALAVREAVTNVLRHAHATRCRIALSATNGTCRLEVQDDGRGGGREPEGAGLAGMRERVERLGGAVAREGGAGTRILVSVPVAADGAGGAA